MQNHIISYRRIFICSTCWRLSIQFFNTSGLVVGGHPAKTAKSSLPTNPNHICSDPRI